MSNLTLHIEYLLRSHSCVILPGIGAFLCTRQSARYDEARGLLEAPDERISFNSSIKTDDGLLAHSVARREGIPYEEAVVSVADEIEVYRQILDEEKELAIGRIGRLILNEDSRLDFHPAARRSAVMRRAFDINSFKTKEEERDKVKVEVEESSDNLPDSRYINFRIPRRALRVAAMIGIFLLTATIFLTVPGSYRSDSPVTAYNASVVPEIKKVQDTPDAGIAVPDADKDNTSLSEDIDAETVNEVDTAEDEYYLIVATFRSSEECETFINQQTDTDNLQIICSGKVCRVVYASSPSREEMVELLRSDKVKETFSQAWIWKRS